MEKSASSVKKGKSVVSAATAARTKTAARTGKSITQKSTKSSKSLDALELEPSRELRRKRSRSTYNGTVLDVVGYEAPVAVASARARASASATSSVYAARVYVADALLQQETGRDASVIRISLLPPPAAGSTGSTLKKWGEAVEHADGSLHLDSE